MFLMRIVSAIMVLLLATGLAVAQNKQNNSWCFGVDGGINFNTTPVSPFVPDISSREGVASVSNRYTGDLLFFCTTSGLFNAAGNFVKSIGTDINSTTAQGVAIVPALDDTGKFYIFALSDYTTKGNLYLSEYYKTPSSTNPPAITKELLDTGFAESVVMMEGCGMYWVVFQKKLSGDFYAYKVTTQGLDRTPVISKVTYTTLPLGIQTMKFSPDKKKIAVAAFADASSSKSYVALHDFDRLLGTVSNTVIIDEKNGGEYYGCEFSPNSKRLYVSGNGSKRVYQFDLSLGSLAAITGSRKAMMQTTHPLGALQMGADSNIYVSLDDSVFLDVITDADLVFPNCVYTKHAVTLPPNSHARLGLPQAVVYATEKADSTKSVFTDTAMCLDAPITIYSRGLGVTYQWQDGSTGDSLKISQPGTYWVRMRDGCRNVTDTIVIKQKIDTIRNAAIDTTICPNVTLTLQPSVTDSTADHYWSTFSTDDSIKVNADGVYWGRSTVGCLVTFDTFGVDVVDLSVVLHNDTSLCVGDSLVLQNYGVDNGADITWSTGSKDPQITVKEAGSYALTATYMGCTETDDVVVDYYTDLQVQIVGKDELCKGDRTTLQAIVTSSIADSLVWYDNTLGEELEIKQAGRYFVTAYNSCQTVKDSFDVRGRNCHFFFPSAFSPNGDGRNDKARMVGDVAVVSDYSLNIINRWGEAVFSTTDATQGWDGTYKGQKAEVGTYYYIIKYTYEGEEELLKGDLMLVR